MTPVADSQPIGIKITHGHLDVAPSSSSAASSSLIRMFSTKYGHHSRGSPKR